MFLRAAVDSAGILGGRKVESSKRKKHDSATFVMYFHVVHCGILRLHTCCDLVMSIFTHLAAVVTGVRLGVVVSGAEC